ncbi:MAG TPA: glycoside hydrolase family 3 N-terminal domain-containing protein [Gaiellaceae bacterium]|nr:glycoside hydrolase family 3 N-terminal domain-containing protein [Gaiellaceae bacterium]
MSAELERLAAGCLLAGFEGPTVPDWLRRWLDAGLGGVVLFAWNVESREQVAELTAALRSERELVVAIDEEGGDVTRLEAASGSSYPGNWALGVVDEAALTMSVAQAIGADLAAVGVNVDLAPVADVNSNPLNPIVGVRSFGSDSRLVARHVGAFVTGLQRTGVAACVKHFPGHGDTQEDSHFELPTVDRDEETMAAMLLPFRSAIDSKARAVMTAHIRVEGLDDVPATVSRAVIGDLLRGDLGFTGVVMTDALEMRAVSATVGSEEGAVRALEAGADALCLGHDLRPEPVHAAIVEAVRTGRLENGRVAEAAARVADLGRSTFERFDQSPDVGLEVARRALVADGTVALRRPPLVVELSPEASIAAGSSNHGLADVLQSATALRLHDAPLDPRTLVEEHFDRQLVVVVRDAHRHTWERVAVQALLEAAPDGVVVEVGVPVWRPDGVGYIGTHGQGRVNLEAAAERLQP